MTSRNQITEKITGFFKQNFIDVTRRDVWLWAAVIVGLSAVGAFMAYFSFRESFGVGDPSTFFRFAHNLMVGEAIYKDFIHFRTPGSYFNEALFLRLFGDQMSSLSLALQFESHVMYTSIFGLGVGLFLKFKKPLLGLAILTPILLLPAYLQVRSALAFLAIMLYIQAKRNEKTRHVWLVLSGIAAGIAFIFGQEAAVMVALVVVVTEISLWDKGKWRIQIKNILMLAGGALIGLLPFIIYLLAVSDIRTFAYYALYYAFVLQPKGMDLPYPILSYENILFYLVPLLVGVCFYIFYSYREAGLAYAILLTFVIARFVTLFGRSDMPHLIFVLPEVFFVAALALVTVAKAHFTREGLLRFLPYGIVLLVSLIMAKQSSSIFIFIGALAIMLAFRFRQPVIVATKVTSVQLAVCASVSGLVAIMAFIMYPTLRSTIDLMSFRGVTGTSIGGVNTDATTASQVNAVKAAVEKHKPTTLFSYPIQAYYYTFAPKHAARFLTFEPQTTVAEQDQTISDLQRTKPEVVVFDPLQAAGLSKALWKINNYIMTNYVISETVVSKEILWIMVPREDTKQQVSYLSFMLKKDGFNSAPEQQAYDVQSPEKGINNGLMHAAKSKLEFKPAGEMVPETLALSVYFNEIQPTSACGEVVLYYDKREVKTKVCAQDGRVALPVEQGLGKIELVNLDAMQSIVWNDVLLTGRSK